jgi:hypothetical protein
MSGNRNLPQSERKGATGPRTAAGKRRSAQNARRHGLTAIQSGFLGPEAAISEIIDDPQLAGLDRAIVTRFAEAAHRLERVKSYQQELFAQDTEILLQDAYQLRLVQRYRAEAEAAFRKSLECLLAALDIAQHRPGAVS